MTKDRRILIVFVVSVIVNLALVAYIVGSQLATHRSYNSADLNPSYALAAMVRSLPPERVEQLIPNYQARIRDEVRPYYVRLRDAQARWYRAMRAKEVNQEHLERAINDYWTIRQSAQSVSDKVFVEMVVQLTWEERIELFRALQQTRARYDEWRRSRTRRDDTQREDSERVQRDTNTANQPKEDP